MADIIDHRLSAFGGEFADRMQESAFREERISETSRHLRLFFVLSAVLNALFLISDWRFYGQLHFFAAIPARLIVILISVICFISVKTITHFKQAERRMLIWQGVTAIAVGVLVTSHSDLALFVVLMLPSIYYLVVPTSFRWSLIAGFTCSIIMLSGYVYGDPAHTIALGLAIAMLMLNFALILVLSQSNRLRRMEWSATLAERKAKEELAESRSMFETLFRTVPVPLVVVKADGTIINTNDAAVSYFGASQEALGIQNIDELYINPRDRNLFIAELKREGRVSNFETLVRLADGSIRNVLLAGTAFEIGGVASIITGVIDITEHKATEERIWRAASHDPLTDLPNRALFQSRFEQALAEAMRDARMIGLFLIDLDDFKAINDIMGHDAGDIFLKEIAKRLRQTIPDVDMVARLGGDEFVVIVSTALDHSHMQILAERILAELRRPFLYKDTPIIGRASIGIALYPEHDSKPTDLMKDADLALYAAKAQGRNRAVLFTPDMRNFIEQGVSITQDIHAALRERQIVPFYQPKLNLETGQIIGFEALARWQHPKLGLLTPASFPSAFEDPDLSIIFGEYMFRAVASDIRRWLDEGVNCGRIAVNLSTAQFSWVGLAKRLLEIVQGANVPPERLDVEITETVFLGKSSAHVATALKQFHESGVKIALDDFGTGYASLIHLKQFPVNEIKIDQSFVKGIERDTENAAIVIAVIQLGKSLHMDVIAEGVETLEELQFLQSHGCLYIQGNLYAKPMQAEDVPTFIRQNQAMSLSKRLH